MTRDIKSHVITKHGIIIIILYVHVHAAFSLHPIIYQWSIQLYYRFLVHISADNDEVKWEDYTDA